MSLGGNWVYRTWIGEIVIEFFIYRPWGENETLIRFNTCNLFDKLLLLHQKRSKKFQGYICGGLFYLIFFQKSPSNFFRLWDFKAGASCRLFSFIIFFLHYLWCNSLFNSSYTKVFDNKIPTLFYSKRLLKVHEILKRVKMVYLKSPEFTFQFTELETG